MDLMSANIGLGEYDYLSADYRHGHIPPSSIDGTTGSSTGSDQNIQIALANLEKLGINLPEDLKNSTFIDTLYKFGFSDAINRASDYHETDEAKKAAAYFLKKYPGLSANGNGSGINTTYLMIGGATLLVIFLIMK